MTATIIDLAQRRYSRQAERIRRVLAGFDYVLNRPWMTITHPVCGRSITLQSPDEERIRAAVQAHRCGPGTTWTGQ